MATDDYVPQRSYQDDFGGGPDPIMNEKDDPTEELGIPAKEFATELDRMDEGDDARERIEDLDEDDHQEGKTV